VFEWLILPEQRCIHPEKILSGLTHRQTSSHVRLRNPAVLAETKKFIRIAERIGRTQSVTGMQIHKLEELTGAPLCKRAHRNVELPAVGERLRGSAAARF
jgi:hypothetical protein